MSSNSSSSTVQKSRATDAIAGIQKYFSALTSLNLAGVVYTPTQLVALLQAYATAITALQALHAQLSAAVSEDRAQRKQMQVVLLALESFARNFFGSTSDKLADFGFAPRKASTVTVVTKAAALEKSKATRVARHTMGSKQKKSITGESDGPATPAVTQSGSASTPPKV
jgi:hypothetical protein